MVPDLLREARGHVDDAERFWTEIETCDNPDKLRLLVSEWQHAVDMCSQSIEDYWLQVDIEDLTERDRANRAAAKAYTDAINAARGDEPW